MGTIKSKSKKEDSVYMVMAVWWDHEYLDKYEELYDKKAEPLKRTEKFSKWLQSSVKNIGRSEYTRRRVWGYFRSLKTAKQSVLENWGDNFDEGGYYNGAIIERVTEGYFNYHIKDRYFFRRTKAKKWKMKEFKEPRYYECIVGLTLG